MSAERLYVVRRSWERPTMRGTVTCREFMRVLFVPSRLVTWDPTAATATRFTAADAVAAVHEAQLWSLGDTEVCALPDVQEQSS